MSYFVFIPVILGAIVSVALLNNAEKEEEYISKMWCFIFAALFVWLTIFLAKKTVEHSDSYNKTTHEEIYYSY